MKKLRKQVLILVIFLIIMAGLFAHEAYGTEITIPPANEGNTAENENTNQTNTAGNNTLSNTSTNLTSNNNTTLPQTGLDDTVIYIMIIFVISAIFAYKKTRDYRLK